MNSYKINKLKPSDAYMPQKTNDTMTFGMAIDEAVF